MDTEPIGKVRIQAQPESRTLMQISAGLGHFLAGALQEG